MDNVPAWVDVASTVGAALAGGIVGAAGAILGPVFADKRVAKREEALATTERNSALSLVGAEVKGNLATVNVLRMGPLAAHADPIEDSNYIAGRDVLARHLDPEDVVSLEELYAQLRQLREDLEAGEDIAGTLEIIAENGRRRLDLIQKVMKTNVHVAS